MCVCGGGGGGGGGVGISGVQTLRRQKAASSTDVVLIQKETSPSPSSSSVGVFVVRPLTAGCRAQVTKSLLHIITDGGKRKRNSQYPDDAPGLVVHLLLLLLAALLSACANASLEPGPDFKLHTPVDP